MLSTNNEEDYKLKNILIFLTQNNLTSCNTHSYTLAGIENSPKHYQLNYNFILSSV